MDPLSVSASVAGILGASAKASTILTSFIKNTRAAPKLARNVLTEVSGITVVLSQLQTFVLGSAGVTRERGTLILVEQVLVTLTQCVITFSELEEILQAVKVDPEMGMLDRMKWATKESKISSVLRNLQDNKGSLTLMLTILQCKSMEEAERSQDKLYSIVEQILASNQEMCQRLRGLEGVSKGPVVNADLGSPDNSSVKGDLASTHSSTGGADGPVKLTVRRKPVAGATYGFAFEEDLQNSQVYKRSLFSESGASLVTSATRTTASSVLSGLSISDVSRISVLALPIYSVEISNRERYSFGDFSLEPLQDELRNDQLKTKGNTKSSRWRSIGSSFRKSASNSYPQDDGVVGERILGVPLEISIRYANVAISLTNEDGESFIYGYVPVYVAKIGVFLKEKGMDVVDLFSISGHPVRLRELESAFDNPNRYGKGLDWTGYTVHDAASILIRFLVSSPESVIPSAFYRQFQDPIRLPEAEAICNAEVQSSGSGGFHEDKTIKAYQKLILSLAPLSRQLLLYLLDLFAVFASKSDISHTTPARLAAIFQPCILSPVRKDEEFIEDPAARMLSQDVLTFLIVNQDDFLIGMTGS